MIFLYPMNIHCSPLYEFVFFLLQTTGITFLRRSSYWFNGHFFFAVLFPLVFQQLLRLSFFFFYNRFASSFIYFFAWFLNVFISLRWRMRRWLWCSSFSSNLDFYQIFVFLVFRILPNMLRIFIPGVKLFTQLRLFLSQKLDYFYSSIENSVIPEVRIFLMTR